MSQVTSIIKAWLVSSRTASNKPGQQDAMAVFFTPFSTLSQTSSTLRYGKHFSIVALQLSISPGHEPTVAESRALSAFPLVMHTAAQSGESIPFFSSGTGTKHDVS